MTMISGNRMSDLMGSFFPYAAQCIAFRIFLGIANGSLDADNPDEYELAASEAWSHMVPTVKYIGDNFSSMDGDAFVEKVRLDVDRLVPHYMELLASEVDDKVEELAEELKKLRARWN